MRKLQRITPPVKPTAQLTYVCEADVAAGLEPIASQELTQRFRKQVRLFPVPKHNSTSGIVRFEFSGNLRELLKLQTVQAVFLVRHFPVPRPKALLGDEHFRILLKQIDIARQLFPAQTYRTFHVDAAGSDSSVMIRLKNELEAKIGLREDCEAGDLLLRLRRSLAHESGWEALVRLSPRPLATRPWRVCNFEGALNATVAQAMVRLTQPTIEDTFLNIGCGSGTLLIERLACMPARRIIGCDNNPSALNCAEANIHASGYASVIQLLSSDARALPLADNSVDILCADLPFGQLVGSHAENRTLYPRILSEAARVAKPSATCTVITHEIRLVETMLSQQKDWRIEQTLMVTLRGLHPRIFVLHKLAEN